MKSVIKVGEGRRSGALLGMLALLLMVVAVSGCGGGSDTGGSVSSGGGDSDPQPVSTAVFEKQGNAVCAEARNAIESESRDLSQELSGSTEEEVAGYVSQFLVPWVETAISELNGVGLPKGNAKQAGVMIAAYEATLARIEAKPALAFGKDPFGAANKMATEMGLTECVV
jgi:hypothetical protein